MEEGNDLTKEALFLAAKSAPAAIKKLANLVQNSDPRVALSACEILFRITWPDRLPAQWGGWSGGFGGDDAWINPGDFGGVHGG